MPAKDYIPSKDGDLVPWTENFIAVANANLAVLGIVATDITSLTTKKTDYSANLNLSTAKQAEAKASTDKKNFSKDSLKDFIRVLARQIQAKPGVPDNIKVQLGLNSSEPSPSPTYPSAPTDLAAEIIAGNTCSLKWNRNTNPQGTIFLIETSINQDKDWRIIGTTTKTTYETPIPEPGQHNYFRVKAQRGDLISDPSNIAAV